MAGRADIVAAVTDQVEGISRKQATEAFDAIFESITICLKRGERVQLPKFGSFSVSKRAARKGRNPATGEIITIKASKNVRFRVGKELKEAVNKKR